MSVVVEFPVGWGDMDAFQHVNNTVYFRWFEHARIAYFERCGFIQSMEEDQVGPILGYTDCRFRRALSYPDTVTVTARVRDVEEDRFVMEYEVHSEKLDDVAATGTGKIVCFDYHRNDKVPIPESVRAAITRLEGA